MEKQMSHPGLAETPDISVIICTRDRGETLLMAVCSVLADAATDGTVEVLVIDQGRDDAVERTLTPLMQADGRLRYLHESSVGLSVARNVGLRAARGRLIVFTDDDCQAVPGWLATLKAAFDAHPEVGLIFGHVGRAPHDPEQGFLPGFAPKEGPLKRWRLFAGTAHWGIGANMALRRSAWELVGPFDELLGAGAPFKSAEDLDYVLRTVRKGIGIYHCEQALVIHYGFRPHVLVAGLIKGYALGCGAMYAKHVRVGNLFVTVLMVIDNARCAWNIVRNGLRGRRPLGANILIYGMKGLWRGLRLPLDRRYTSAGPVFLAREKML
jgi:glycosyltransferase involved in cell wall biosynthesis